MTHQHPAGTGNLRDHRLSRMLTQQEVAEQLGELAWVLYKRRVGINPDMVSKWERGQKMPSRFYVRLLCQLYDVTPAALGLERPVHPDPPASGGSASSLASAEVADLLGPDAQLLQASLFTLWKDDMLNRRQLLVALGLTPAAIGLGHLEVPLGLTAPALEPFRGGETVTMLEAVSGRLEASYHTAQPDRLLLPVKALGHTAERYVASARAQDQRRRLLAVCARAQLLAGRLSFFDLHRPMDARAYFDLAREAALEAQDALLVCAALGHMAFLPAEHHHLAAAASYLAGARQELRSFEAPGIASWIAAVESEMRCVAGEFDAARAALDHAHALLSSASATTPPWFDYYDPGRLAGFEGFFSRRSGDLEAARCELETALAWSATRFPKQRAVLTLDLATVCSEQGDLDAACALAAEAVGGLRAAGYATAVHRLREFHGALPDPRHPAARLLQDAIVELS